jgi:hypothetical protein
MQSREENCKYEERKNGSCIRRIFSTEGTIIFLQNNNVGVIRNLRSN